MLTPDPLAAGVPQILADVEVLPNLFGLPDTAERKMPEHIVDEVEKTLSKDRRWCRGSILLGPGK
jgi:hypothetical protein